MPSVTGLYFYLDLVSACYMACPHGTMVLAKWRWCADLANLQLGNVAFLGAGACAYVELADAHGLGCMLLFFLTPDQPRDYPGS